MLVGPHVDDSESRHANNAAHRREDLQLKVDRLESLKFAQHLRVTAANNDLALSVFVDRQVQLHLSLRLIVEPERDLLRFFKLKAHLTLVDQLNFNLLLHLDHRFAVLRDWDFARPIGSDLEHALVTEVISPENRDEAEFMRLGVVKLVVWVNGFDQIHVRADVELLEDGAVCK